MSTALRKRPLALAIEDAVAFQNLFTPDCYESWTVAGSVRRQLPLVGDVEHVVVPRFGEVTDSSSLFAEPKKVDLVMHRLDELVKAGGITKHVYSGTNGATHRWGERYRGADFRGFCHEVFLADVDNVGSVLAIRTGPAGYSKMLVNALQRNGYCNAEGYVWNKNDIRCGCGWRGQFAGERGLMFVAPEDWDQVVGTKGGKFIKPKFFNGRDRAGVCPACRQQDRLDMQRVAARDEAAYFKLCGLGYVNPNARFDPVADAAGDARSVGCPYCGGRAHLCRSSAHRFQGRDFGPIYECQPCDAFVGVHPGTVDPLGSPADTLTRGARARAHAAFDVLWKSGELTRSAAYAWLSEVLRIDGDRCHIGMFTIEQCEDVIDAVGRRNPATATKLFHSEGGHK